jgi:alkanesulfonate monooxygenase SsuD/methylene tetrahydromethanopterin reductase-like flavin-dependent oxidoreductase (luciferase family)
MEAWYFTEMPYPHLPPQDSYESDRVSLSNGYFDPEIGAGLYNRYLDEYVIADDLGLNLMLNEHHQTPSCLDAAVPLTAAILARETSKGRILVLGNPVANRADPVRIAEEMAMVDCISRGRLDAGFVRGVPYEIFASNTNPALTTDRLWDGLDLIIKAWTTRDGPFNFESPFWHKRAVNIWPTPYQDPHPPIWTTGSSDSPIIDRVAKRGYHFASFLQPHDKVRVLFDRYRAAATDGPEAASRRLGFMPLVAVGETEKEAFERAEHLRWFLRSKGAPQFRNPPGYVPVDVNVLALKGAFAGRTAAIRQEGTDYLIEKGVVMAGTPDQVVAQVERFYENVGGMGHLLMMLQAGFLDHEETVRNITLFAKEVYPRIRHLAAPAAGEQSETRSEAASAPPGDS